MVHEQADPPPGILQVEEDGALHTLPPQGSPEALDLAERLRVPGPRYDLANAALLQLAGELALSPPGHVLRAVVGQDLLRCRVGSQRRPQHFQHQGRRLTGVQPVADGEAAVVVHECHQVDPAILPFEHECEQISLPELVRLGPLSGECS